jgi:short-subunit dehydrogenase
MPTERFTGRTVLITGASTGVGAAAARAFAAEGAERVLAARGAERLHAIAGELGALAIAADVSNAAQCRLLIEKTVEARGGLDVLVNNAGCNHRGPLETVADGDLAQIIDTNLRAPILLTRLALPHLRAGAGGAVVNVASIAGQIPVPDEAAYSASKFGLRAFTCALAEELRGTGVTVSAVSPGPIATGFILDDPDKVPDLVFSQPMSTAEQVAALVLDCAADGRVERSIPTSSHALATVGYLWPSLPRLVRPLLERKGRREKAKYRS